MVAEDFLQDPQVRQWLDGVEPAWTLLSLDSLRSLRQEPSAVQTTIRIANDLSTGEIAGSPVARNTLMLLRQAVERGGLPLTATGNLSRAVVAANRIEAGILLLQDEQVLDAFRLANKVMAVAARRRFGTMQGKDPASVDAPAWRPNSKPAKWAHCGRQS